MARELTLNSPELSHVTWLTPKDLFERFRLPAEIAMRLRPSVRQVPVDFSGLARAAHNAVAIEFIRNKSIARHAPPRGERPESFRPSRLPGSGFFHQRIKE
jgi:hypothetical protein